MYISQLGAMCRARGVVCCCCLCWSTQRVTEALQRCGPAAELLARSTTPPLQTRNARHSFAALPAISIKVEPHRAARAATWRPGKVTKCAGQADTRAARSGCPNNKRYQRSSQRGARGATEALHEVDHRGRRLGRRVVVGAVARIDGHEGRLQMGCVHLCMLCVCVVCVVCNLCCAVRVLAWGQWPALTVTRDACVCAYGFRLCVLPYVSG